MHPDDPVTFTLTAAECERLLTLLSAPLQPALQLIGKIQKQATALANGHDAAPQVSEAADVSH